MHVARQPCGEVPSAVMMLQQGAWEGCSWGTHAVGADADAWVTSARISRQNCIRPVVSVLTCILCAEPIRCAQGQSELGRGTVLCVNYQLPAAGLPLICT